MTDLSNNRYRYCHSAMPACSRHLPYRTVPYRTVPYRGKTPNSGNSERRVLSRAYTGCDHIRDSYGGKRWGLYHLKGSQSKVER